MAIDTQEILNKINAKLAELQAKIGGLGSTSQIGTARGDFLFANRFNDSNIAGVDGNDKIFGGFGNDLLLGGNLELSSSNSGDDLIDGGSGDDEILGGDGDDRLFGKFGSDDIYGEDGEDEIYGGLDDDFLDGGNDNDILFGDPGNDQLFGGPGIDILTGAGNLTGDIEVDFLVGGGSLDFVTGNASFAPDNAPDLFVLGNANGSFYTNSGPANTGGILGVGDVAVVLDFESGIDKIQLSSESSPDLDFQIRGGLFSGISTQIFDNGDLIGIVDGVVLDVDNSDGTIDVTFA
ncbi:MAG: calcium-binding protein [Trichodesmium sp. MO_231.B1]|nr:calcium-binding protein [Trichodesmium sp. MO_231.B1]